MRVRKILTNPACRFDEIDAVIVVFFQARCDCENVRIEDDVLRWEIQLCGEEVIGAFADFGLARKRIGLPHFVERHHDDSSAMTPRDGCLVEKLFLTFLHRNRIDDGLALNAFEAGLNHVEFRGIDHDRHAGDVRLGCDKVKKLDHRLFGIEQALIHVYVNDLRAVLDLIACNLEGGREVTVLDQLSESRRTRDVGAFAHINEGNIGGEDEWLQT